MLLHRPAGSTATKPEAHAWVGCPGRAREREQLHTGGSNSCCPFFSGYRSSLAKQMSGPWCWVPQCWVPAARCRRCRSSGPATLQEWLTLGFPPALPAGGGGPWCSWGPSGRVRLVSVPFHSAAISFQLPPRRRRTPVPFTPAQWHCFPEEQRRLSVGFCSSAICLSSS